MRLMTIERFLPPFNISLPLSRIISDEQFDRLFLHQKFTNKFAFCHLHLTRTSVYTSPSYNNYMYISLGNFPAIESIGNTICTLNLKRCRFARSREKRY